MSAHFLDIASELRNEIYELLLLHEKAINPWSNCDEEFNVGLFLTNKAIHRESSSLLYGQNSFDFSMRPPESIASFLRQIGTSNAGFIRTIYINFSDFHTLGVGDITVEGDNVEIIEQIRNCCANVSTLILALHSTDAAELRLDALDNAYVITEALELVNTHLRAISSLEEIIVEVYEDGPNDQMRREMVELGWKVKSAKLEDCNRSFSDGDDSVVDYDNDSLEVDYDSFNDDYDIDNDSDFWRRAAD